MKVHVLENSQLKLEILPEAGGRIWSIEQKWNRKQWLWHNPNAENCRVEPGTSYDDNWIGGWDDLFPNDAAMEWDGQVRPDHGELWSACWQVETFLPGQSMSLSYLGKVFPYQVQKTIELLPETDVGRASFRVRYELLSLSDQFQQVLFKLHPAFAIEPGDRLLLDGGEVEAVDQSFSSWIGSPDRTPWPRVQTANGGVHDLSVIPPLDTLGKEFWYVHGLKQGRFEVQDSRGNSCKMSYPQDIFPNFWVFMDWGGWRGFRVAVMEPCTNYPKDLAEAVRQSNFLKLLPSQKLSFTVDISLSS